MITTMLTYLVIFVQFETGTSGAKNGEESYITANAGSYGSPEVDAYKAPAPAGISYSLSGAQS